MFMLPNDEKRNAMSGQRYAKTENRRAKSTHKRKKGDKNSKQNKKKKTKQMQIIKTFSIGHQTNKHIEKADEKKV